MTTRRWLLPVGVLWIVEFLTLRALSRGAVAFVVDCLGWVILSGILAYFAQQRSRSDTGTSNGWRWVAAGASLLGLISVVDAGLFLAVGRLPLPPLVITVADNAPWACFLIGALSWSGRGTRGGAALRAALDAVLFAASFLALAWWARGAELSLASTLGALRTVRSALPIVLSSAGLGVVAFLAARSPERLKGPLGWYGLAFLGLMVGGLTYAWATLTANFYTGHPLDAMFQLPVLAFALAATSPAAIPPPVATDDSGNLLGDVLTNLPAFLALSLAAVHSVVGAPPNVVANVLTVCIVVLLLTRQMVAVRDVRQLSQLLERRVIERTRALNQSQTALIRAQRMEALGRMAGGVAHDFNNVLGAISGHVELLRDDLPRTDPNQELAGAIDEAAKSGRELVKRLLVFARPVAESPRRVSANEALARAAQIAKGIARGRMQVELLSTTPDAAAFIDPVLLDQVLTNLVVNAIDAMPSGGTLTLSADRVAAGNDPERWQVRFLVRDQGQGMDEDTQARIFEPFFSTKVGERGGTGLGLSTAYAIVSQAGGSIAVISQPGAGSTFEVLLSEAAPTVASRAATE